MVYAKDLKDFDKKKKALLRMKCLNETVRTYLKELFKAERDWAVAYRRAEKLPTRGHDTNNIGMLKLKLCYLNN